jgi:hypothetical protein
MTEETHIFVASDDSCPRCDALDGEEVPPGFLAHANCHCRTVPRSEADICLWDYESQTHRTGNGWADFHIEVRVRVLCPDKTEVGASLSLDGADYEGDDGLDRLLDDLEEKAEELAQDICDSCARTSDPSDFPCV